MSLGGLTHIEGILGRMGCCFAHIIFADEEYGFGGILFGPPADSYMVYGDSLHRPHIRMIRAAAKHPVRARMAIVKWWIVAHRDI